MCLTVLCIVGKVIIFSSIETESKDFRVVKQLSCRISHHVTDKNRIDHYVCPGKIFVGGLPESCDGTMLKAYFATAVDPNVLEARVMTDPRNGTI